LESWHKRDPPQLPAALGEWKQIKKIKAKLFLIRLSASLESLDLADEHR
jgi:hypothetical protein